MTAKLRPCTTYGAVIGRVLVAGRTKAGLTQADVAARLRLTQSSWSRIERGVTPLTVLQLTAVARLLDRAPHDLLRAADETAACAQAHGIEVVRGLPDATHWVLVGTQALDRMIGSTP